MPSFRALRPWLRVLRLEFQLDNLFPWCTAAAVACASGHELHVGWLVLGTVMLVLSQAALELCDGYYDFVQGAHGRKDGAPTWTGGSGVLAEGLLAPKRVQIAAFATGAVAAVLFAAITFAWTRTGGLVVGAVGATCGAFWAMPPLKLSYRGLGEVLQGIVVGPLMAAEAWVIATGHLDARAFAVGVPFGLVEMAMGLSHNMIDLERDALAKKRTLVVRIGLAWAARLHALLMVLAAGSLALLSVTGILRPSAVWIAILLVPFAAPACAATLRAAKSHSARDDLARRFPAFRVLVALGVGVLAISLPASRREATAILLVLAVAGFFPTLAALRKVAWPNVYDLFAPLYNAVSGLMFFENRVRKSAVRALLTTGTGGRSHRDRSAARVLDLGCGTGFHFPEISAVIGRAVHIVGVDPSAPSLAVAAKRARSIGVSFHPIVGDGAHASLPAGELDGVIAAFSLSVMPHWREAIARGAQMLAPGARFVILEQDVAKEGPLSLFRPLFVAINRFLSASLDRDYATELAAAGLVVRVERHGAYAVIIGEKQGIRDRDDRASPRERDGSVALHVDDEGAPDPALPAVARGKVEESDAVLDARGDRGRRASVARRARVDHVAFRGDVEPYDDAHLREVAHSDELALQTFAGDLGARGAEHGVDPRVRQWILAATARQCRNRGEQEHERETACAKRALGEDEAKPRFGARRRGSSARETHGFTLSKNSYLSYLADKNGTPDDAAGTMHRRERAFERLLARRPAHMIAATESARHACVLLEKLIAAEAYGVSRGMGATTADDPLYFISREEAYHVRIGDAVLALFGRSRRPQPPSTLTRFGVRAMSLLPSFLAEVLVYWGERFGSHAFVEAAQRILPSLPDPHRAYAEALFLDLLRDEAEHTAWAHFSLGHFQKRIADLLFPLFSRFAAGELSGLDREVHDCDAEPRLVG